MRKKLLLFPVRFTNLTMERRFAGSRLARLASRVSPILLIVIVISCAMPETHTAEQRYYALKSDYRSLLSIAVAYKQQCVIKPEKHSCYKDVEDLQRLDNDMRDILREADTLLAHNQGGQFTLAADSAARVLERLSDYLYHLNIEEE